MTPAEWRSMVTVENPSLFYIPPQYQGLATTHSYAQHKEYKEYIFERIEATSAGSVKTVVVKVYRATEREFEPWKLPPVLGELLWTEFQSPQGHKAT